MQANVSTENQSVALTEQSKKRKSFAAALNKENGLKRRADKEEKETTEQMVFDDTDDDIEEDVRDTEALDICMAEISKPSEDIAEDDWVLVSFSCKKRRNILLGRLFLFMKKKSWK